MAKGPVETLSGRYLTPLDSAYTHKTYENQNLRHQSLLAAGKDEGIGHFGTFTLDALRIEKGFKMWGNEMNLDVDVWEAGLGSFIRMKKKVCGLREEILFTSYIY